jgi:hypothetical protein
MTSRSFTTTSSCSHVQSSFLFRTPLCCLLLPPPHLHSTHTVFFHIRLALWVRLQLQRCSNTTRHSHRSGELPSLTVRPLHLTPASRLCGTLIDPILSPHRAEFTGMTLVMWVRLPLERRSSTTRPSHRCRECGGERLFPLFLAFGALGCHPDFSNTSSTVQPLPK